MPETRSRAAQERAYVRRIERRFNALRESGLYISPRDFALLIDWHERGVPAELVLSAIEMVFQKAAVRSGAGKISSISYCRRAVEDAWEERRAALLGAQAPAGTSDRGAFTPEEVTAHLEACAAGTEAAADCLSSQAVPPVAARTSDGPGETKGPGGAETPGRAGCIESSPGSGKPAPLAARRQRDSEAIEAARVTLLGISRRLGELRRGMEVSPVCELQALEAELVKLEESAVASARAALPRSEADQLARAAEDSLAAFAARMSDKARASTLRRAVESAVRARFKLPRYSLFTMVR